jgi:ketosteroid isomerase-like protein
MDDVDAFLSSVMPQLAHEVRSLQAGDPAPRLALWSDREPVTLFGAILTKRGRGEIEPAFRYLATTFHGSESYEYDVLAAGVSGDLAYVAGIEHSVAAMAVGSEPVRYVLRVTTVFRREDGVWKIVHRHGDPYDPSSGDGPTALSTPSAAAEPDTGRSPAGA